jgi:peptide-methionine (R)-S-oxide reductase
MGAKMRVKRYQLFYSLFVLIAVSASIVLLNQLGCSATTTVSPMAAEPEATPSAKNAISTEHPRTIELTDGEFDGKEIKKKDSEWKAELTPDEYAVMRQEGTERPFTGELANNHENGTYYCAACGLAIFSSQTKFESGTGWPSFYKVLFKKNVIEREDRSLGDVRIKVECARCHAHLGHVFDDGPQPTGLRYCMNSLSLRFRADPNTK